MDNEKYNYGDEVWFIKDYRLEKGYFSYATTDFDYLYYIIKWGDGKTTSRAAGEFSRSKSKMIPLLRAELIRELALVEATTSKLEAAFKLLEEEEKKEREAKPGGADGSA
jgi:hypothetical protein